MLLVDVKERNYLKNRNRQYFRGNKKFKDVETIWTSSLNNGVWRVPNKAVARNAQCFRFQFKLGFVCRSTVLFLYSKKRVQNGISGTLTALKITLEQLK
ncbi:hypothetical protein NM06_15575 [Vibrio sinaloensis]|uniref:Uncharacterized protein n=1 Tax=Photobacterium sp. (strain ATCC 43367) TaxID=379097 RepID=A0A0A5HWC1_PHOS4|nr:hypothetical protein NM06_15575 [Vibrio sinaloensis]